MDFSDKIVLIVGGSSGIGAACVRQFSNHHATVIFCSNDKENGEKLERELLDKRCKFVFCEVTTEENIRSVIDYVRKRHGERLDCLINNVGTHPEDRTIDEFSAADLNDLFQINVMSHFLFSKYSLPLLRTNRGCIIHIGSQVGSIGQKNAVTYALTKGAVAAMSKSLALDEAQNGVRVNCVSPGIIDTPLLTQNTIDNVKVKRNSDFDKEIERMKMSIPLGSIGSANDVASLCLFLASDMATYITGADIPVSGGAEIGYGIKCAKYFN